MSEERLIIESLFRIPDKDTRLDVDFKLNPEQAELDSALTGRDIVPKARQLGITTYILAQKLAKCLHLRNRNCVIISHEGKATQRLLRHVHYMIKHLKCPAPDIQYASKNEITFPSTDSAIYIGTAGADNFGHGDTITDLHGSEVARWPDPATLLKGVFQAVPSSGCVTLESTGDGQGNWYHRACMRAAQGIGYKLHFFNWLNRPEYQISLTPDQERRLVETLEPEFEEQEYIDRGLTLSQIGWRRKKIEELDYDVQAFKEQYPISLDECFQSSGKSFFKRIHFFTVPAWQSENRRLSVLFDHPRQGRTYVLGGDVSAGVGKDGSVGEVFDLESGEQVAEWWSNTTEPDEFGDQMYELGKRFNWAYINIERNNHGILTIKRLLEKKYPRLHKGKISLLAAAREYGRIADYGTFTSVITRAQAIGALRQLLADELTVHSELLKSELDSFAEQENGKIEANEGCLDDRVLASAMAAFVMPRAAAYLPQPAVRNSNPADVGEVDAILLELEGRYSGGESAYPMSHFTVDGV